MSHFFLDARLSFACPLDAINAAAWQQRLLDTILVLTMPEIIKCIAICSASYACRHVFAMTECIVYPHKQLIRTCRRQHTKH